MLEKMWRNKNSYTLLLGVQINTTIMEISMEISKRLEMEPYDPIPLLSIFPKELKLEYYNDIYISMLITGQYTTVKLWNQPGCPCTD